MLRLLITLAAVAFALPAAAQHDGMHAQDDAHVHDESHDHDGHQHKDEATEDSVTAAPMTQTPEIKAALDAGGEPIVVDVLGVVCDFCAKAMNKTFGKRDEIAAVYVDLDTKALNLVTRPAMTMTDETLVKLVKKAGYKAADIRRGEAALKGVSDAADAS